MTLAWSIGIVVVAVTGGLYWLFMSPYSQVFGRYPYRGDRTDRLGRYDGRWRTLGCLCRLDRKRRRLVGFGDKGLRCRLRKSGTLSLIEGPADQVSGEGADQGTADRAAR